MASAQESPANTTLLAAGTKCKADHCGLYDFLPYKCQFCSESYCSDHFRPGSHSCAKYVSSDRIAPPCPICHTPISIKPNEDPNDAMEAHFTNSCPVMLGSAAKARLNSTPRCSRGKCDKVLYTPITCESCNKQFCATHRHPDSHACTSLSSSSTPSKATPAKNKAPRADLSDRLRSGLNLGSSPSSVKAKPTPAVRKTTPAVSSLPSKAPAPVQATSANASGPSKSAAVHNPFSKVDRSVSSLPSAPTPLSFPTSTSPSPSSSSPSTPPSPKTTMQAIIETNAQKPKPHLLFSSFSPPSLFGTA